MAAKLLPFFISHLDNKFLHHQIKKRLAVTTHVTKSFDKTLDAIDDLEEAITEARTQKLTADPKKIQDLNKIISILEKAQNVIIEAVVIFEKHEKAL